MSETKRNLDALLEEGKSVLLTPTGHSMEPLLHPGAAQVLIDPLPEKPRKGDILLWHRRDGSYILHRMIGENERQYLLRGDYGTKVNHAKKSRVIGVVSAMKRRKNWFSANNPIYRGYVRIWLLSYPLRAWFYRIKKKTSVRSQSE